MGKLATEMMDPLELNAVRRRIAKQESLIQARQIALAWSALRELLKDGAAREQFLNMAVERCDGLVRRAAAQSDEVAARVALTQAMAWSRLVRPLSRLCGQPESFASALGAVALCAGELKLAPEAKAALHELNRFTDGEAEAGRPIFPDDRAQKIADEVARLLADDSEQRRQDQRAHGTRIGADGIETAIQEIGR